MKHPLRLAAYAACILQILCAGAVLSQAYGSRDMLMSVLLAVAPILAIIALRCGPDREERELVSKVNKARLRKELQDLESKA